MGGAGLTLHPDKTRGVDVIPADGHCDFLGYRFKRSYRCLLDGEITVIASLRRGATHSLESRMREICQSGSECGTLRWRLLQMEALRHGARNSGVAKKTERIAPL